MIHASTIQLLRFHFSFFLLPVYLFALGQIDAIDPLKAILIFTILHLLVYPSSNGYNSYMDRDEGSIGGIEKPMAPTRQLFRVSVAMDIAAVLSGLFVSRTFATSLLIYILSSRAYSYRGIRLKKYPVTGYITVIVCQGALVFFMVFLGANVDRYPEIPWIAVIASSLLIGGFYPLTQVYQHEADNKDGVRTISAMLGYRGTFIFTALIYTLAMGLLAQYFYSGKQEIKFLVLATIMSPVLVYFFRWASKVWRNESEANFRNTMQMNLVASICTNIAFITLLTWNIFE